MILRVTLRDEADKPTANVKSLAKPEATVCYAHTKRSEIMLLRFTPYVHGVHLWKTTRHCQKEEARMRINLTHARRIPLPQAAQPDRSLKRRH